MHVLVPKGGFEPPLPEENCALNAARLPFRHFGTHRKVLLEGP